MNLNNNPFIMSSWQMVNTFEIPLMQIFTARQGHQSCLMQLIISVWDNNFHLDKAILAANIL